MPERGKCFSMAQATLSGPVEVEEKMLGQPQEIQRERKESRRTSETAQETWLDGAQRGSLWLCYVGPLTEKRKSEISGKRHRPKLIPWKRNSLRVRRGGRRRRREYTIFGFDLGERGEQVVCHASALVLAMTDEAHQEAEMYAWRSSSLL